MFDLTRKNGTTRIYLTDGTANGGGISGPSAANYWRTDNGDQPAAALLASQAAGVDAATGHDRYPQTYNGWQNLTSKTTASPYFATDDFCTGQCWYDEEVYTPAGMPDTVYVIGSNSTASSRATPRASAAATAAPTAARCSTRPPPATRTATNNSRTFTDLSYDHRTNGDRGARTRRTSTTAACNAPGGIHPDQHAIVVNPGNPTQIFEGSDGGVIRTSGTFADARPTATARTATAAAPLPPTSGSYLDVQAGAVADPVQLDHIDKKLSSSLQFINVAINPANSCEVMGGTQDNGTWSNIDNCDRNTFTQVIYGDGGNAVYDGRTRPGGANEFTSCFGDSNFENGDPERWVIATGPIAAAARPVPSTGRRSATRTPSYNGDVTHPIYNGAQHVWRSWAFGAGTPGQVPQDTTPNVADYEANCPEFVDPARRRPELRRLPAARRAGRRKPAGRPDRIRLRGDRSGGSVSWLARDRRTPGPCGPRPVQAASS